MKSGLQIIVFILTLTSITCGDGPEIMLYSNKQHLTYQNIIILSDLSNRIDKNPPNKDLTEIHKLTQYFRNECVKPGTKIGDKSSIYFSAFSSNEILSIDLDNLETTNQKQEFVNSTGSYINKGLDSQIVIFERSIKKIYNNTKDPGLDLISLLIEKIENAKIIKRDTFLTDGVDTTYIKYDNHIYIFTDGLLEYQDKDINNQFYFSTKEIENVRKYSLLNGLSINKAIEINNNLNLPEYLKNNNKYISLHIRETLEGDKNLIKNTYKHQLGYRDNEILEAIWKRWAIASGFKDLDWGKY